MPVLASGEVLIRVLAATVNPSDYGEWTNVTSVADDTFKPRAIGKEGSGIVVASGGGIYANSVVGKKVGFISNVKGQGSYGEFTVVNALEVCARSDYRITPVNSALILSHLTQGVFPLPDSLPCEDAAGHFVNPYTACGFLDVVRTRHPLTGDGKGKPGLIHTAAASQLGQMLVKLCKQEDVNLINVVRRQEQADLLRSLGAEHIVVTSMQGWEDRLSALVKELNVRIAFDAIAGEMSGKLIQLLPYKGLLVVYGALSKEGCSGIPPVELIYRKKLLEGFYLPTWLQAGDPVTMLMRVRNATALVHAGLQEGGWACSQFVDCTLDDMFEKFVNMYNDSGFTGKKLRVRFVNPDARVQSQSPEE